MGNRNDIAEFVERIQSSDQRFDKSLESNKIRGVNCESTDPNETPPCNDGKLWAVSGDKFFACEKSVDCLPSNYYSVNFHPSLGYYFRQQNLTTDDLLDLPDCASEDTIIEIEKFWLLENHYRQYGFLWKRGFLLWGPPGGGKTSTVQMIIQKIIQRGGIAVSVYNPSVAAESFKMLRKIEPHRPFVSVLEDIDAIARAYGESDLLSLLDGEHQVDNIVTIATTNYPESLDPRIINRPSRFDTIYKIGMPSIKARIVYLAKKSKILCENPDELEKWAKDTDGFSIAHIKELIISVEVFGGDYSESLMRLRTMAECSSNSKEYLTKPMGFLQKQQVPCMSGTTNG
jgi:predicted AAA+ superfamily ATPase